MLKETNAYELVIDDEADLAGLPAGVGAARPADGAQAGLAEGKWVFTLHKPSI